MVELALEQLSAKKIIELDEDKKATMVSNLLVVLCSETDTTLLSTLAPSVIDQQIFPCAEDK